MRSRKWTMALDDENQLGGESSLCGRRCTAAAGSYAGRVRHADELGQAR